MLNKIKMVLVVVLVVLADLVSVIGISSIVANSNIELAEVKAELAILEEANKDDIEFKLTIDNLSFMLNGMTEKDAREAGLKNNMVVALSKQSDNSYSDIAIVTFNKNDMLTYSTISMLNNKIDSIYNNILTIVILATAIVSIIIITIVFAIADYIDNKKTDKEISEIKAIRENKAITKAPIVVREATELIANIEDNDFVIYNKNMGLLYEAIEEVKNNASSRSVLNLECTMQMIANSIVC